ncbi:hypothetical protein [Natronomonas marina]|jgi:hypothetical protein|uniref:hypothetical protein n=1 Tax=Natronomonas marina TaxID=2961939 RepID=UPI0020CA20F1|nr:hypothetical protein [Natronomonas marina]
MASYYDLVLGLIPLSLAGLTALFLTGGLEMSVAVPLASTVAVGLMGHAMFVNAPVAAVPQGGNAGRTAEAASATHPTTE